MFPVGVADQILDAGEIGFDFAEGKGWLDDGDPGQGETSIESASERPFFAPGTGGIPDSDGGALGGAGHLTPVWSEPSTVRVDLKSPARISRRIANSVRRSPIDLETIFPLGSLPRISARVRARTMRGRGTISWGVR